MPESSQTSIAAAQLRERSLGADRFHALVYWVLGTFLLAQFGVMFWLDLRR